LEFAIDTDMNRALIEVMNRLNQVPRYPVDANEPVISVGGSSFEKVIAWFAVAKKPGKAGEGAGSIQDRYIWRPNS
jgi:multidrug efflux pump subunit AcrB